MSSTVTKKEHAKDAKKSAERTREQKRQTVVILRILLIIKRNQLICIKLIVLS